MGSRTTPSAEPTWEIAWSMTTDRSPHKRVCSLLPRWRGQSLTRGQGPLAPTPRGGTHQGASGSVRSSKERTTVAYARWGVPRRGTLPAPRCTPPP